MARTFFPNFGAEERDVPPAKAPRPVLQHLDTAWRTLFEPGGLFADVDADAFVAWLNTELAVRKAFKAQQTLFGSDPRIVAEVHDKAFCVDVVRQRKLLDPKIDALITVLSPDEVDVDAIAAATRFPPGWPSTPGHPPSFTIKPRFGTSGRGRVDSRSPDHIAKAIPRLKALGGVVIEPWLLRRGDFASQWRVHDDGRIEFFGTSTGNISPGGLWQSSDVNIDDDGGARAGLWYDGRPFEQHREFCEASYFVVEAARDRGYVGPCGVDGFLFVDHETNEHRLRIVELNARFTAGMVAVGLARGLPPGTRARFAPSTSAALSFPTPGA